MIIFFIFFFIMRVTSKNHHQINRDEKYVTFSDVTTISSYGCRIQTKNLSIKVELCSGEFNSKFRQRADYTIKS